MEIVDPVTPPWIAEDDLLLRTAIETGASLEALAKGAVRFSRRYTLSEIRDRWKSLLYDPCESKRASFRMSETDSINVGHASKLCKIASFKESEDKSTKRKTESIRRNYYAMRKRIRGQPFDDDDLDFTNQGFYEYHLPADQVTLNGLHGDRIITNTRLLESGHETLGTLEPVGGEDGHQGNNLNEKKLSNAGDLCREHGQQEQCCFNFPVSDGLVQMHSIGLSSPMNMEPLWKITKDVQAPLLPISATSCDKTHDTENRSRHPDDDHDCLLNKNEVGLLFMDMDCSASADKSCYDNLNSLLLSSPIYTHGESGPPDTASVTKDRGLHLATSVLTSPATLDITSNPLESGNCNNSDICLEALISSPSSVQKTRGLEYHNLDMPCLLNAEFEDVPNNDDIFPTEVVDAVQSLSQDTYEKAPTISDMKVDNPSQTVFVLGARPAPLLKAGGNHDTKSSAKAKFQDTAAQGGKLYKNGQIVPDNGKTFKPSHPSVIGDLENEAGRAELKKPDTKFGQLVLPEKISQSISPDDEELESEDDVPYFSDVEALVLEMDLCTYDEDPLTFARVSRYRDEDAKKQIMRLEQCARSYMDRRIESHGAFAILYGRRLKHYINKPEVILGRSTEDMEVDVDLAREGRANKISRQQACIRLEKDGSFTATNLGKFKISVNGMELESGHYVTLSSSNLIEIRGMSFIFEASHKLVRRFLASARQTSRNQA